MPPPATNSHHQASKISSVGRLEALEADLAILKAERAVDILTSTIARWIDQFHSSERPASMSPAPDESRSIPESFKEDVVRALADHPATSSLLQTPNLWPALQEAYHEVVQERQKKLLQSLTLVNTIIRHSKSQEKKLSRKRNTNKNQKLAVVTTEARGETETTVDAYKATDFHPAHCAAASADEAIITNENGGGNEENAKDTAPQQSDKAAVPSRQEIISTEPPIVLDVSANDIEPSSKAPVTKRGRRRPLTAAHGKKSARASMKVGVGLTTQDVIKASMMPPFVIPADPLNAIMHSMVPAYMSDDDHKFFGEVRGMERRRIPQAVESDSGIATRPRRARKSRKMPKAP